MVEHTRKTARGRTKEKMEAERLASKINFGRTEGQILASDETFDSNADDQLLESKNMQAVER